MMKKEYSKPIAEIVEIEAAEEIATEGELGYSIFSLDFDDEPTSVIDL